MGGGGEGGNSHKQSEELGGVVWVYKIGLKSQMRERTNCKKNN